ncbi:3-keto-5-aminohexanoate cleavage protein [Microbacterium sp. NPDC089696]|uniref:3-keto-5-aminohexanoate cleavage protein n=1 Tax=Microbacterium sp. NPDC089696 TaxID=3364199 RepID=UPI0037F9B627
MTTIRKVIITCAITGSIHTPSMSPHLPITQNEIADQAIAAWEAGAAIIHLHARSPQDGRPSQDPDDYIPVLEQIKKHTDAVVSITTGGNPAMTVDERMRPIKAFKPELASLNMGSMNFANHLMLDRFSDFKYDWEEPQLKRSKDVVFKNTFADIENILEIGAANGTKFEFECYDTSHIYNLHHMHQRGLTRGPLFVQSVFGLLGGTGTHPEDLMHIRRTADRLLGDDYRWSILGVGKSQLPLGMMGVTMGSHIRVGLEDSLWIEPNEQAHSNAHQVTKARAALENLSFDIATSADARDILQLKGKANVGY